MALGFSHHSRSGHLLPHHQTSYPHLVLILVLAGLGLAAFTTTAAAGPPQTEQGSISLSGEVSGPPPSTAPTIAQPTNGQHFSQNPITVSGSCTSGLIIKVFRNGSLAGSANCSAGSFSLSIDLVVGQNNLVARGYDSLDQPSPDSATVVVFLDLQSNSPILPTQRTGGQAATAASSGVSQLLITTDSAYKGIFPDQALTWTATIQGGRGPYAVSWDWGDGKIDLVSRQTPGSFQIEHTYAKPGRYKVVVKVADASGQTAQLELVTIVNGQVPSTTGSKTPLSGQLLVAWPLLLVAIQIVISFWLGEAYQRRLDRRQIQPA